MNNITDWINYTLYPTLFERIDMAFPEHNFKRFSGGWRSKTYLDGSAHQSRDDKTIITKQAPGRIMEQGGTSMTLVDYVIKSTGYDFISAVKKLADIAGETVPSNSDFNRDEFQKYERITTVLEDCNSYFIWCLENSPGAKGVRDYLTLRGYTQDDIKAMELGYIPSQDQLTDYLKKKGHTQTLIDEVLTIKTDTRIGTTHNISIPYRSGGTIKGFKFRTSGDAHPKYLNTQGLDKISGFFNLSGIKGDKDVIIVEGEFDALNATVKGLVNVVALGGSSISIDQVNDAKRRGAKSFTICLDAEPGKEAETQKHIKSIVEVILNCGVNRVYIVTLPTENGQKTDPDSLIREKGIQALRSALSTRLTWGAYLAEILFSEYESKYNESGLMDYKERDILRIKAVEIRSGLSAENRIDFNRHIIEPLKDHGFNEEILTSLEEDYKTAQEEANRNQRLDKLLRDTQQIKDKGEALKSLKNGLKLIDQTTGKGLLPEPISFNYLLNEIANIHPSHKTGYRSLDRFVSFKSSAITLIAGRPSHGKTTFMFNLLLQMSELYPDETFYFFTYEEPVKNLSVKLLTRIIDEDLTRHFERDENSNYEFLKGYIAARRTDITEVEEGKRKLGNLIDSHRIQIVDRNYSVEELASLIAYLNKREKIGSIFIDYIQRMRTDRKTQDKRTEVAHISDQVLQIAKDSSLPIILGAQLNRASADKKKPSLENLKEAGNLEEDANTVLSVYNESREKAETDSGEKYTDKRNVSLEIKALKNREGEVNKHTDLLFDKWTWAIKDTQGNQYFSKQ